METIFKYARTKFMLGLEQFFYTDGIINLFISGRFILIPYLDTRLDANQFFNTVVDIKFIKYRIIDLINNQYKKLDYKVSSMHDLIERIKYIHSIETFYDRWFTFRQTYEYN